MWIGEWAAAYPTAIVHGPAALRAKRPDLRIDRAHDEPGRGAIDDGIEAVHVDGFWLEETVLVHSPSSTAIVTDLFHHIGTPPDARTRLYASVMGSYGKVAMSRAIRWTAFRDRRAARRSVDAILEHPIARVVVGHGAPIERDARAAFVEATAWLAAAGPAPARLTPGRPGALPAPRPCG